MKGYASNTGTRRNLQALRETGWGILLTPDNATPRDGLQHGVDNGAWKAFIQRVDFDADGFERVLEKGGSTADFVVIPDIVAGGLKSLDFSLSWLQRLKGYPKLLLPLQDGMTEKIIGQVLTENRHLGLFLGGSTEWKLKTMFSWGEFAARYARHYHVGRVNSARRIRMCEEAGAHSFDGTSATMYAKTLPLLNAARQFRSLLSVRLTENCELRTENCSASVADEP
jgi:hypothetical protein